MGELRQISATVRFLGPENGGRTTPIFSGYRPAFYFGEKQTDGAIILVGADKALPGERCFVNIRLLNSELLEGELEVGRPFEVKEGLRQVGFGRISSVTVAEREDLGSDRGSYSEHEANPQSTTGQAFYPNEGDDGPYRRGDNPREDKSA